MFHAAALSATSTSHMLPVFTIFKHVQMIKNLRDQCLSMQATRRKESKELIAKIAFKKISDNVPGNASGRARGSC